MSFEHIKWAWNADKGLNASEQLVLLALADRANKSGVCWPSIPTITDDTHLNRKTVIRCISVLEHRGLVAVIKTHGDSNRYQLQKPPADLQPVLDYVEGVSIVAQGVVPNLPGVVPKTAPKPIINQSKSKTTTPVEPVQVIDAHDVVVEKELINKHEIVKRAPLKEITSTKSIDDIQGIEPQHQAVAKRALSRLTPEQASAVLVAFTLAVSKTAISNKTGYFISLTKAAINGTFSPVQATGTASVLTLDERLAKEKEREREAQERGKMSNEQYMAWLERMYSRPQPATSKPAASSRLSALRTALVI